MFESNMNAPYTSQYSNMSSQSSDNGSISSLATSSNIVQYGPLQIRLCRKPAPTIATGRRSKHLVLIGEEAMKREKRREKNREAARKLKEKRQSIEDELNQKLKELENENSNLQNHLHQLKGRKQILEDKLENIFTQSLDELLSNDNQHTTLTIEHYSGDFDSFDEEVESILNFNDNTDFKCNS